MIGVWRAISIDFDMLDGKNVGILFRMTQQGRVTVGKGFGKRALLSAGAVHLNDQGGKNERPGN